MMSTNMTYKALKYMATLVMMLVAVSCELLGVTPPTHQTESSATFSVGNNVGAQTTQQFVSIISEGEWSLSIDYPTEGENWCSLTPTEGTGNANVMMIFGKNEGEAERSLTITARFEDKTLQLDFTQSSAFSLSNNAQLKGWLELPEFTDDRNRYYFTKHMLPSSENTKRSFSALYDTQNFIPLWVAYPLCKDNMGSGKRVDTWGIYDPNIPQEKQLYMKYSYQGNYDRGHMLPSASRIVNGSDNSQTFYPTNMTPQLDRLNQAKWANIEDQVRKWAEGCDTLYVVTGAVLQTVGGNESVGHTYCKSDSGKSVAIPNYYYKALLQYHNEDGEKVYQAIGIWVEHKAASGGITTDDLVTIDELERRLGYDLFSNLDPAIQAQIESSYDTNNYWPNISE